MKAERKSPKKTKSTNGGIELLQMVLEQDICDVPASRLSFKGYGYEAVCQQGRRGPKGVD